MTTNTSKTILFCIFDKIAKEHGMITETRNWETANRQFNQFMTQSNLSPDDFELIHLANVRRESTEDEEQNVTETKIYLDTQEAN